MANLPKSKSAAVTSAPATPRANRPGIREPLEDKREKQGQQRERQEKIDRPPTLVNSASAMPSSASQRSVDFSVFTIRQGRLPRAFAVAG
jgi:hypothetical protein